MKDQEILHESKLLDSLEQDIDQQQLDQYLGVVLAMDVDVQTKKRLITAIVSTWQQQQQSVVQEIQQLRSEIRQHEELGKARDNQVLKQVSFIRRGLEFVRNIFASKN
ncbi:hypothetical protein [Shimazuella alba]|uniref:Uncharacterized protein n=1 Tax=Shimazuella alba TaxID=2690964 RepID=A0A6I4VSB4_9BACL|nr:hypothetical protein [Shimazuella alba]MXQ52700.1 hypothetical protein [Shimazuella alba]